MLIDQHFLIVLASGIGSRMNANKPKQYLKLKNGLSVLDQSLKTLLNIEKIKGCIVTIAENDTNFKDSAFAQHKKILRTATGGKKRFQSVMSALQALRPFVKNSDWVLVHDSARPCVQASDVENLIKELNHNPVGGLLATPVVDTIKKSNANTTKSTLNRSQLWQAQTPQMYRFSILLKALNNAINNNLPVTDEANSVEYLGLESVLVKSSKSNFKITVEKDLELANFYLNSK